MHLRLAIDNTTHESPKTPIEVTTYTDMLQERRAALERDLEYYSQRLRDTAPRGACAVSLQPVYEAHATRIRELLRSL